MATRGASIMTIDGHLQQVGRRTRRGRERSLELFSFFLSARPTRRTGKKKKGALRGNVQ